MRYSELFETKPIPSSPQELILYILDRLNSTGQNSQDSDKVCQLMYGNRQLEADLAEIEREETNLDFEKKRSAIEELINQAEIDETLREKIQKMARRMLKQDL